MAVPLLQSFDPSGPVRFTAWLQLFNNHCLLYQVPEEPRNQQGHFFQQNNARRALFIASLGIRHFASLQGACAPHHPTELPIPLLATHLTRRYEPPTLEVTARYSFRQRLQKPNESALDFISAIQTLALPCNFGAEYDRCLRDQIVCGVSSVEMRKRLINTPNLNYAVARDMLCTEESVTQLAMSVAQTIPSINKVQSTPKKKTSSTKKNPAPSTSTSRKSSAPASSTAKSTPTCYHCGSQDSSHIFKTCYAKQLTCKYCSKTGHIQKACRSRSRVHSVNSTPDSPQVSDPPTEPPAIQTVRAPTSSPHEAEFDLDRMMSFGIHCINAASSIPPTSSSPCLTTSVKINNQSVLMEIDSAAAYSVMSTQQCQALFPRGDILPCELRLFSLTGPITLIGQLQVSVTWDQQPTIELPLLICQSVSSFKPLLGRNWLDVLRPDWRSCFLQSSAANHLTSAPSIDQLSQRYPRVFDSAADSCIEGHLARLTLRPDAIPVRAKEYSLAFAQVPVVDRILDSWESTGKAVKVTQAEWASPSVVVKKKDGSPRLCVDFKRTLNPALRVDHYPLPRPDDVFVNLANGRVFTSLDLSDAYTQLRLHPDSQKLCVVATHRGFYQLTRLIYGVASAASIFQETMDKILRGIPGVVCYIDNILCVGCDLDQCILRTLSVLDKLNAANVRLRLDKCIWFAPQVDYLGHIISAAGRSPAPALVQAIVKFPRPSSAQQIRSFLGMLQFYSPFLPNISTVAAPLRHLTKNDVSFSWTDQQESAFMTCKQLLTSCQLLIHFDPDLPLVLAVDASPVGVGAVLSHTVLLNGKETERPIAFASSSLLPHQQNYAQIDREALGVVFGITKFHKFLWGRPFKLITDNSAIRHIFAPDKALPARTGHRLQHWATLLQAYNYSIQHRKAALMVPADTLSRHPLPDVATSSLDGACHSLSAASLPLNSAVLADATAKDSVLSRVCEITHLGWPSTCPAPALRPYFDVRSHLSLQDSCLLFQGRVVVPPACQQQVLQLLHCGHPGMVRTKALARSYVWWPSLNTDIESMISYCSPCVLANTKPSPTLVPWPTASTPFQRVHLDFFEIAKTVHLIIADSFSKWLHIEILRTTTASDVLNVLLSIFGILGLPSCLVTDNGPPFDSQAMKDFCTLFDIILLHSPPYHPQSNGLAEKAVQTAKSALKKMYDPVPTTATPDFLSSQSALLKQFLLAYRNTPSSVTGRSPNSLLLSYTPRSLLSILLPHSPTSLHKFLFREGEKVAIKFKGRPLIMGIVMRHLGPTYCLINVQGVIKHVHVNNLVRTV